MKLLAVFTEAFKGHQTQFVVKALVPRKSND